MAIFFTSFETQVAWLAIRLAVFLATVALAWNGVRTELAAAGGDSRRVHQVWELTSEAAVGFALVVLAPSIVSGLVLVNGLAHPTLSSLSQVPLMGAALVAVEYGIVQWGVPIGLLVCNVMLFGLGLYTIVGSTTTNFKIQERVWSGVIRIGIAVIIILALPWVLPEICLFFLQLVKAMGVPLP